MSCRSLEPYSAVSVIGEAPMQTFVFCFDAEQQQLDRGYGVTPTQSLTATDKPSVQQPFRAMDTPSEKEMKGHGNFTIVSPTSQQAHSGQTQAAGSSPAVTSISISNDDAPLLPQPPPTTGTPTEAALTPEGASETVNSQPEATCSSNCSSSSNGSNHLVSSEDHAPPQVHTAANATKNGTTTSESHVSHGSVESTPAGGSAAEGTAIKAHHAARAGNGSPTATTAPNPSQASGGVPDVISRGDDARAGSADRAEHTGSKKVIETMVDETEGDGKRPAVAVPSGGRRHPPAKNGEGLLPSPRTGNSVYDTLIHVSTPSSNTLFSKGIKAPCCCAPHSFHEITLNGSPIILSPL